MGVIPKTPGRSRTGAPALAKQRRRETEACMMLILQRPSVTRSRPLERVVTGDSRGR